jgi:hypothetical protein
MFDANDETSTPGQFRQKRNFAASSQQRTYEQPNYLLAPGRLGRKEPRPVGNCSLRDVRFVRGRGDLAIRARAGLTAHSIDIEPAGSAGGGLLYLKQFHRAI